MAGTVARTLPLCIWFAYTDTQLQSNGMVYQRTYLQPLALLQFRLLLYCSARVYMTWHGMHPILRVLPSFFHFLLALFSIHLCAATVFNITVCVSLLVFYFRTNSNSSRSSLPFILFSLLSCVSFFFFIASLVRFGFYTQ